jgi:tetratricopeptide (TPR) repeat protein
MVKSSTPISVRYIAGSFFVLACFVFAIYSNTLGSPWILDDFDNIVANDSIHIEELSAASLQRSLKSSLEGFKLDRPLARMTFALNWYAGGDNPFGFHLVNIAIHALCAVLLFLTVSALNQTARGGGGRSPAVQSSLLAALLWAANPVQTQAVTYIVQRMALLAGLFYLSGLYCFIRGRQTRIAFRRVLWWCGTLLGFLLGVGSKENAMLLPLALLLTEIVFFTERGRGDARRRLVAVALAAAALCALGGAYVFAQGDLFALISYKTRFFSLPERLLTQPRVLLFYLSQLFYPAPGRLSLEHDIHVSTSLLDPWTTLPGIAVVFFLIAAAFKTYRTWPWFGFSILFFFLNHAIESSFVPLELVFEHRNYLPSMFLFVPLARGVSAGLESLRRKRPRMLPAAAGVVIFLILSLGGATYMRNTAWASAESLWTDAVAKAPSSARALAYLALVQNEVAGREEKTLALYRSALTRTKANRQLEPEILNNMAAIYYARGDYEQAARHWEKALAVNPDYAAARYRLALALLKSGHPETAGAELDRLIAARTGGPEVVNLRGVAFFRAGRFEDARREFEAALKQDPGFDPGVINSAAVAVVTGQYDRAQTLFESLSGTVQQGLPVLLWRLQSALSRGDGVLAAACAARLKAAAGADEVARWLSLNESALLFQERVMLPAPSRGLSQQVGELFRPSPTHSREAS